MAVTPAPETTPAPAPAPEPAPATTVVPPGDVRTADRAAGELDELGRDRLAGGLAGGGQHLLEQRADLAAVVVGQHDVGVLVDAGRGGDHRLEVGGLRVGDGRLVDQHGDGQPLDRARRFGDLDIAEEAAAEAFATAVERWPADGVPDVVLEPTTDILAELGRRKPAGQVLVGFAAETGDLRAGAEDKLRRKHLDLIVANDVTAPGVGFGHETNAATLLDIAGTWTDVPLTTKRNLARIVLDVVSRCLSETGLGADAKGGT